MPGLFTPVSPATARLETLLRRHGGGARLAAGGREWRLEPACSGEFEGPKAYARLGDSEVAVWLAEPEWRLVVAETLGIPAESVNGCPEPLILAALECVAKDALAAVEQATGLAATLISLDLAPSRPIGGVVRFSLVGVQGLVVRFAALFAKPGGQWAGAMEKALLALPPIRRPLPEDLPLPAAVQAGSLRVRVDSGMFAGLSRGDVVLFPSGSAWSVLLCGRRRFAAEVVDGTLRVKGGGMAEPVANTAGNETPVDVDSLEVEVTAQVGRITLTLGQLRQLSAGQVLEFPTLVESPVRLLVGAKTVATGELVDVGGRVGVRLIAVGDGDPATA